MSLLERGRQEDLCPGMPLTLLMTGLVPASSFYQSHRCLVNGDATHVEVVLHLREFARQLCAHEAAARCRPKLQRVRKEHDARKRMLERCALQVRC